MISIDSFGTFSGLFDFVATLALFARRWTAAALLFIVVGAAGTGIFWDRWSSDAGDQTQVLALTSGQLPSSGELVLLATHFPLLLVGVAMFCWLLRERSDEGRVTC